MNYFSLCHFNVWRVYLVSTVCPAACAVFKGCSGEGLEKTCLPERRHKQQLAGLLGVSDYWQLHSVEELLLCVAFTSNCNLFAGC